MQLRDDAHQIVLSILPSAGNLAFKMTVKGQDVLRWPFESVDEFKDSSRSSRPAVSRSLGESARQQAFYANGTGSRSTWPSETFAATSPSTDFCRGDQRVEGGRGEVGRGVRTGRQSVLEFYRNPAWDEAVAVRTHRDDDLSSAAREPLDVVRRPLKT